MFAVNTALFSTGKNISEIAVNLNILASDILAWARQNRMELNATKTKCMIVTSQQNNVDTCPPKILMYQLMTILSNKSVAPKSLA